MERWIEWVLDRTWGWLAFKWFYRAARKRKVYGDYAVVPPGYEFRGWIEHYPAKDGAFDPLDARTTVGYKLFPSTEKYEGGLSVIFAEMNSVTVKNEGEL